MTSESDRIAKYKSHTHREHIYKICDTYIGSTECHTELSWKVDNEKMTQKNLSYIPGLYKIVDELVVNAWDQFIRCRDNKTSKVTFINIEVHPETGVVSVTNDGKGIDILIHPEHKIYTVEMIFGKLLTSTNYTEGEERITGGKNGYGAKLANIFSKWFEVETVDLNTKKKYYQKFTDNMTKIEKPVITEKYNSKEFTRISFLPDFERFNIKGWTTDMMDIFHRRAYELAAACGGSVKVNFNDTMIPIRRFKEFCGMFFENSDSIISETVGTRWEVAIGVSDEFKSVSFVNGVNTSKGGKHVDYVVQSICKRMVDIIQKKEKITVKASYIKEHMFILVNSIIVNPSFDSQTKDYLTTPIAKFGSKCELSDKFYDALVKLGIIEKVVETYQFKESKQIKKTDGKKKNRIYGIPKLDDANEAGGKKSSECTLILTEGDSAKAMAVAGLSVVGRDLFGVFPLRGKVINAREKITKKQGHAQVMNNTELIHMKQILGLEQGAKYSDTSKLRYGHIMIMTDQDYDGSHIKGLIINWFDTFWPELLKIEGFIQCMQTPIIKAFNKSQEKLFYSIQKYEEWKDDNEKGWKIKYYKGLGTSTTQEAKKYFKNMMKQEYLWDEGTQNTIDMAFNGERSNDRKSWLQQHDKTAVLDEDPKVPYTDFINKELIHFSNYDLQRSVPHIMDGLKPSQRKILYSCFKRNLKSEIRVAQLAGYVSEHSGYHHGEESLNKAIISMAQNYVGSNNIHLLEPNGQFGTRLLSGKDAGSPRYLHTQLADISYKLFHPDDEKILDYIDDDGHLVEPETYYPVIPFVLVNGCQGIGTGYSTYIPPYNPIELVKLMKAKLNNENYPKLIPYFNGFKGRVYKIDEKDNFMTKGLYEIMNYKTILIKELPIGSCFDSFKNFLDEIIVDLTTVQKKSDKVPKKNTKSEFKGVKNYRSQSTESHAHFEIEVEPLVLKEWLNKAAQEKHSGELIDNIEKRFRLTSKMSTTNMHLYSNKGFVKKYKNYEEIADDFYEQRLTIYEKRKQYLLNKIEHEMKVLENKVRFIEMNISGELEIKNHSKPSLITFLEEKEFMKENETFNYLINMPMYQLTKDLVEQLRNTYQSKKNEFEYIKQKTIQKFWIEDLDQLEASIQTHMIVPENDKVKRSRLKKT
tara:strand:+ start:7847 stop:11287 length:3441 start_codon:yes stop_codon:yes gene_type:complete